MKKPIIKLRFDRKLDQDMAWQFYSASEISGTDFWMERAIRYYPELLNIAKEKNKKLYLEDYIINYYNKHESEIGLLSKEAVKNLNRKQEEFFCQVNKTFKGYPWPQKKIIGNLSIFDFCPRFLEDNEFQVFIYDSQNFQLFTIFHECLHFIFYDFAKTNFPDGLGKMDTESGIFWDIAEVFNAVIQNTKDFRLLHGKIDNIGYPNHADLIKKGAIIWENKRDVRKWTEEMIDLLS
ncbi:MAG: hypothetical protein PHY30_01425 [Candidatus Pacebacteria bacterium]|nr:hypothetical protein [Candidatus Paceibacterota bacterium]